MSIRNSTEESYVLLADSIFDGYFVVLSVESACIASIIICSAYHRCLIRENNILGQFSIYRTIDFFHILSKPFQVVGSTDAIVAIIASCEIVLI